MIEKKQKRAIPRRTKFIWGFVIVCLANASAIMVEQIRRGSGFVPGADGISDCAPTKYEIHMSKASCLWSFIPMIITGIAEILVNPVTYQMAFAEAPHQVIS